MIIFGMLALGQAMNSTGASILIAETMIGLIQGFTPEHLQNVIMLAFIYIITSLFTEFLSNNAAVALMVPIALGIAITLGVDPRPFIIGCCIAASSSYRTARVRADVRGFFSPHRPKLPPMAPAAPRRRASGPHRAPARVAPLPFLDPLSSLRPMCVLSQRRRPQSRCVIARTQLPS